MTALSKREINRRVSGDSDFCIVCSRSEVSPSRLLPSDETETARRVDENTILLSAKESNFRLLPSEYQKYKFGYLF